MTAIGGAEVDIGAGAGDTTIDMVVKLSWLDDSTLVDVSEIPVRKLVLTGAVPKLWLIVEVTFFQYEEITVPETREEISVLKVVSLHVVEKAPETVECVLVL